MTHVAVIDIGKTNVKLALVDRASLTEIAVLTRQNIVHPGPPYPHFDVEGHWEFLLHGLAEFQQNHRVDAISVTTHGACGALLKQDLTLAAPILDYEHPGPEDLADAYGEIHPDFKETGSPRAAMGLNLGAQFHWMLTQDPELLARTAYVVPYPQYWSARLTGVVAAEVTSFGCHTDLWDPHQGKPSSLVERLGLAEKIPPVRKAADVLGPVLPEIAERTGLAPETPVYCGLHDSNASLLPHVLEREPPFSVVSTGTWVIAMAVGGASVELDPDRDLLINVNALADPVPSARFMGGREWDMLVGGDEVAADMGAALESGTMLLPAVVPEFGPFQGLTARWLPSEPKMGTPLRAAAASFYLALVTATSLRLIGHRGVIVVEGPFSRNDAFCRMLSAACDSPVVRSESATGTAQGAALLVPGPNRAGEIEAGETERSEAMRAYAARWQQEVERAQAAQI